MKIPGIRERKHVPLYEGFYSIIQYCHDPILTEGLNIGVVVGKFKFDGDAWPRAVTTVSLETRFAESNERVVQRFGVDEAILNSTKDALVDHLKSAPCRNLLDGGCAGFDEMVFMSRLVVRASILSTNVEDGVALDRLFVECVEAPAWRERDRSRAVRLRQDSAADVQACKNIGFDLTCGSCAALFYTGYGAHEHEPGCATKGRLKERENVVRFIRDQRDDLRAFASNASHSVDLRRSIGREVESFGQIANAIERGEHEPEPEGDR